jgi:dolichol-phosphate hexosyltransferase
LAIKRVLDVDYSCEVELVIVDDGSTDGTSDMLASISEARILNYQHARNQGRGQPSGRLRLWPPVTT